VYLKFKASNINSLLFNLIVGPKQE